jgi:diguanylate cyclase (GGDEF)-like protein
MGRETRSRLLVVDDNPDNIELLRARLQARGYDVDGANGGEEALEMVKANPPDLILLDVMMPKVDGMEVVRRLKADKDLPFIPVIMQTALDSTSNKVEGLDAGADDYITKPINFPELDARVKSLLRIKNLQEDLKIRERELEEMNQRLLTISQTDGLTQIPNRRALEEKLDEFWAHSQRLHEPLSVVMCDIDKFKSVNDNHGHQVGDIVLKEFAALLKDAVREIDRVGRYGGEEFLLLLPGTPLDSATTFAERLREIAKEHTFSFEGGTLSRTMSCGVAAWPHPEIRDQDALLKAADDALYVAKESGRDRVVRYDSAEFNSHTEREQASSGDKSQSRGEGGHPAQKAFGAA